MAELAAFAGVVLRVIQTEQRLNLPCNSRRP